ncbi:MAG: aldehyde dehydrogenase [Bdellovibrionales bacterium]|nr:aldehyde dehydrogenase [Bdellovibrionales bacterium]
MIEFKEQEKILNYIGGELVPASSGQTLPCYEPATGKEYTQVAASDASDVEKAVQAAQKAFPQWSALSQQERSQYLNLLAQKIDENLEVFARAESRDNGKPVSVAKSVDIPRSSYNFRFYAEASSQNQGESYETSAHVFNYVLHQPLGVVGVISPWNLPLYLFTWKIAPALATGNCVVAKPSEITPLTAYLFAKICREVNLPPGVLNIVHGLGGDVGAVLSQHPKIKAISFTGSTSTGQKIAQAAAPTFKKVALEMGGKNPTLVFADCDFEKTVNEVVRSTFSNQGQICLCSSRILVEESIYEKFKNALIEKIKTFRVGDPSDSNTQQGATVSLEHFNKVMSYIELAQKEGGRILTGGRRAIIPGRCENGWFIEPTLIEGLENSCRTNQEEIFGPVATLIPFTSEKEALRLANESTYGLAVSIWSESLSRVHRLARLLEFGTVWVNTWMLRDLRVPFGGSKNSGLGREGGKEALHFFTEPKTVCLNFPGELK